jgi:serine/threonine protein kinase
MLGEAHLRTLKGYNVRHILGQGTFSRVYEAEDVETSLRYAIKVIPKPTNSQVEMEVKLLREINHPSFVKFHELRSDDDCSYIVTELVSNGTLLQHLNARRSFSDHDARAIFTDIYEGVSYLHRELQVAHLDLKLENIMIDSTSHAKIIDLGVARPFSTFASKPLKVGSHPYCSPEMLSGQPVTESTDVWSLGVILYTLVIGEFPFQTNNAMMLTSQILFDQPTFPGRATANFVDLVSRMLEKEPQKRITLEEIGSHPWMCGANSFRATSLPTLSFLTRPFSPSIGFPAMWPQNQTPLNQSCSRCNSKCASRAGRSCPSRPRVALHHMVPIHSPSFSPNRCC